MEQPLNGLQILDGLRFSKNFRAIRAQTVFKNIFSLSLQNQQLDPTNDFDLWGCYEGWLQFYRVTSGVTFTLTVPQYFATALGNTPTTEVVTGVTSPGSYSIWNLAGETVIAVPARSTWAIGQNPVLTNLGKAHGYLVRKGGRCLFVETQPNTIWVGNITGGWPKQYFPRLWACFREDGPQSDVRLWNQTLLAENALIESSKFAVFAGLHFDCTYTASNQANIQRFRSVAFDGYKVVFEKAAQDDKAANFLTVAPTPV